MVDEKRHPPYGRRKNFFDSGVTCDFAQAEAAEATPAVHQAARGVHQGVAGLQFLFRARLHDIRVPGRGRAL